MNYALQILIWISVLEAGIRLIMDVGVGELYQCYGHGVYMNKKGAQHAPYELSCRE